MERVQAIFEYASELDPIEREKFLEKVCGAAPEIMAQVRLKLEQAQADTVELPQPPVARPTEAAKFIFSPGDLLASRYVIVRTISKGGMGEVYEVDDFELRSRVALKTISLKSAAKPNAFEMFRREILLARQVTHPNVCRIYDLGHHNHPDHGDMLFLTMELLNGETLAHRIRNSAPITKMEALPLLRQMIAALSAAHQLNIAHRDFKSGNVILCEPRERSGPGSGPVAAGSSGSVASHSTPPVQAAATPAAPDSGSSSQSGAPRSSPAGNSSSLPASSPSTKGTVVKVTDFGLARSIDGLETTVHGEVWGTPDYMAPEQFHGESSIASDIYSLGVVIYEMFTGKLPHRSSTGERTPDGKLSVAVEKIPAEWRPIVKKCMAYEPADRYTTVDEVWRDLNGGTPAESARPAISKKALRLLATLAMVLVAVLGIAAWYQRDTVRRYFHPSTGPKHIAVLPFESIGDDAGNAAFAEGMGETLTSKLSQLERFQNAFWVVPYSDAKKRKDVEDAYRNLNVNLVITGSMQRAKGDVRITANLIDAKTHKQLGSRIMTASVGDLAVLQDRVWQEVAEMVEVQISPEARKQLDRSNTREPDAYAYYQQGLGYRSRFELSSMDHAIEMLQKAVEKDPKYALAYGGLAEAYAIKYQLTKDPQWIAFADLNARKAKDLDPNLANAYYAVGEVYYQKGQYERALEEFRRALELDPGTVHASYRIATIYRQRGTLKEAEEQYIDLQTRRPGDWSLYTGLGLLYYQTGRYEKAVPQFQSMIDLQPDNPLGYEDLGAVYMQMGRYDDAVSLMKKGLTLKESSDLLSNLGSAYMLSGKYAEAVPIMERAAQLAPHNHDLWRNVADSYRQVPELAPRAPAAYEKALQTAHEELSVNPKSSGALSGIALYEAHLKRRAQAERDIRKAIEAAPNDSEVLFTSALVYEIIGRREIALASLDQANKAGYSIAVIEREPELAALRKDPRYQHWLKQRSAPS